MIVWYSENKRNPDTPWVTAPLASKMSHNPNGEAQFANITVRELPPDTLVSKLDFMPITSAQCINIMRNITKENFTSGDACAKTDAAGDDIAVQTGGMEVLAMDQPQALYQLLQ